jgi:hypothetical protein
VGLCGCKIATECFQEIAGFGTSLLLRVESFTGGKMAGGRMYAVSASALCDAGIVGCGSRGPANDVLEPNEQKSKIAISHTPWYSFCL